MENFEMNGFNEVVKNPELIMSEALENAYKESFDFSDGQHGLEDLQNLI